MKQKGLAPLVIIILIALGLGGYLLYQKQFKPIPVSQQVSQASPSPIASDETVYTEASRSANRKTYTNTEYGFSFQYPPDYKINETNIPVGSNLESSAIILSVEPANFTGSYVTEDPGIYFIVTRVNKDTTLSDRFSKSTDYEFIKVGTYEGAVKNILITSKVEAIEKNLKPYAGGLPVGYKAKKVYLKKDDLIFEIESGNIHDPDSVIKILDQVISTFKFTQ